MFTLYILAILWISCNARYLLQEETEDKTPFLLDEFFSGTFRSTSFNGTWFSDNVLLFKDTNGDILKYDVDSRDSEIFLEASVLANYSGASYAISEDEAYVLIRYNVSTVFRHSTTSLYTVYDIANGDYYHINNQTAVQLAAFAPVGHGLAYVYNNNIYYLMHAYEVENPEQVTTIGEAGVVYCGVPDWVYEEEVFGSGSAFWFSPDGNYLAYATFNDTNVEEFSYFTYGTPGSLDDQYPTIATIKYPKVGTANPVVNTYVYDINLMEITEFELPDTINKDEDNNDYILYDLSWVSNTEVVMISTNRIQNESIILRCTLDGLCQEEVSRSQEDGWLIPAIPLYNSDGNKRIEILPQPVDDDSFNHIVLTDIDNDITQQLTYGRRVVTTIYGWDENNDLVYYGGSVNDTPSQQHVYVVNITDLSNTCLTCDMIVEDENCKYASASFSKSYSYYVRSCTGPNPTYVEILSSNNTSDSIVWEDNASLRENLKLKTIPLRRDLEVPINENFTARVRLILPPDLDESQKYPAIVYTYAGPNSNAISDSYSSGIQNYLTTTREYIYIYIDGRGSGRDGFNKIFQLYRKLGTIEIEDQITVTKYLHENIPYIDPDNTGIWGWSYGGFTAAWALVKDTENVFKFGLSVAPVTSFIYYDTIYTERYMGLPTEEDNLLGYNNTDITRNVEAMRGKLFYLIHGNADDNVHYQQAMALAKALEYADIGFFQQSYPDENHSLTYVTRHLYHTLDKFWARCFGKESPPISVW